jgi:two-component system cell cycle response regulator
MTSLPAPEAPLARAGGQPPVVLVADDELDIRALVALVLRSNGYDVIEARDGNEALALAGERTPDLLLLDIGMPGADGLAVCREIQARGAIAPPVVFLTANADVDARVGGLDAGAIDYIVKPFVARELVARVRAALRAKARQDDLAAEAATDPLTGAVSRRQLDQRLLEAVALARRGRPAACMVIDVDGFKAINDAYGHVAGDRVLRTLAERLRAALRATDVVGRYGGDEFVVLIEATDDGARAVAHKVWGALTAAPVVVADEETDVSATSGGAHAIRVGASVGVASWNHTMDGPEGLVAAADKAMYQAKRFGGNRVAAAGASAGGRARGTSKRPSRPERSRRPA